MATHSSARKLCWMHSTRWPVSNAMSTKTYMHGIAVTSTGTCGLEREHPGTEGSATACVAKQACGRFEFRGEKRHSKRGHGKRKHKESAWIDRCARQAAVSVVDEEVRSERPGAEIVDATGAIGYVAHDDAVFNARESARGASQSLGSFHSRKSCEAQRTWAAPIANGKQREVVFCGACTHALKMSARAQAYRRSPSGNCSARSLHLALRRRQIDLWTCRCAGATVSMLGLLRGES